VSVSASASVLNWSKASHSISTGCAVVQQADCMAAFVLMLLMASSSKASIVHFWTRAEVGHACRLAKSSKLQQRIALKQVCSSNDSSMISEHSTAQIISLAAPLSSPHLKLVRLTDIHAM